MEHVGSGLGLFRPSVLVHLFLPCLSLFGLVISLDVFGKALSQVFFFPVSYKVSVFQSQRR